MLKQFADEFEDNYGKHNVSMNIHLLRHIGHEVFYSGPLWAQSLFGFEAMNGVLVKTVNGTDKVLHQITKRYILKQTLAGTKPKIKTNLVVQETGKINLKPTTEERLLLSIHGVSFDEISFWKAITINGENYTSIMYQETKCIDYYIEFKNSLSGKVKYYVMFANIVYAMVEDFITEKNIDHLKIVTTTGSLSFMPASEINEKLIYMSLCGKEITCKLPNKYEKT